MLLPTTRHALTHRLAVAQVDGRAPSMIGAIACGDTLAWSHAIETTDATQFRIGSLTKTFAAVLVMRLRDEGRVDLDDPLERHLSESPIGTATLRELLSHTAGLASETPGPWWERTSGESRPTLKDMLGVQPFVHPPGHRFHYSNPGFAALGAVVEKLRGKPWGDVLADEILRPLNMSRTSLLPEAPHAQGFAVHPWADAVLPEVVEDVGGMAPAGQLWSTVGDLCRFATVLAGHHGDILSSDTAAEMRTPCSAPDLAGWGTSYGLGVQTLVTGDRNLAGHTGSMPGFLCALWIDIEQQLTAVTLTNTTAGVAIGTVAADLIAIVGDREPRIPDPWKPLATVSEDLLALTGLWYWGPSAHVIKLGDAGALEISRVSGGGRAARFTSTGDGNFVGQNGYFHGETLRGVRDDHGLLTHLDIASFVFTREPYDKTAPIPGGVDAAGWRGQDNSESA